MTAKKILFISYDGMTDPLGQSQVIPYLAGLTPYGYSFIILSCDKPDKYAANKDYVNKLIAPYPIEWVSIPYHKNPPVLSSVYDFFQLRKTAMRLYKTVGYDMIHTRVGLPTLVAQWMKRKTGVKFFNDIRGFWADERVDGGMWNLKNPVYNRIYRFFKKHEYECLTEADANSCLTYAARTEMHRWKNIPGQPLPIEVIPCSADLELFNPDAIDTTLREQFQQELGIQPGELIVSYLGSIGGWYLTAEMMRFCKRLVDRKPEARFLFISPHRHDEIIQAAAQYGVPAGKIITRQAKRHEVPVLLSFSTYSLFFIKPCYSKISSSPTKHGEIMAMGIPVITNGGVGDVQQIVETYKAGYVVENFGDAAFDKVIDQVLAGNTFDKAAIRQGAKEFYALEKAIATYKKVYTGIFDRA
jgi:glycosyltransferase involved in cell wall biosynthesis